MKNVPHPNMFPVAGESAMVATAGEPETPAPADASPKAADGEAPRPASPWANPMLKRAATDASAMPRAKRTVPTVAERVIELLGRRGPMKTKDIAKALDLNIGPSGLQPYVDPARKRGEIVLIERGVWALPGKVSEPASATLKMAEASPAAEKQPARNTPDPVSVAMPEAASPEPAPTPTPMRVPQAAEPAPRAAEPARPQRIPVFQLSVGTAMLISWPDGSVTLQRGGRFVELDESESRMLRMFVALQQP